MVRPGFIYFESSEIPWPVFALTAYTSTPAAIFSAASTWTAGSFTSSAFVRITAGVAPDCHASVNDEPTNGLDPNQILEVRQLIKDIAVDRTVMLSTHILSEVQATCSSIKMIEHGRVVFSGSTEDFDNYIEPNTLYLEFDQLPVVDELMKLPGIKRAEALDNHGVRLWYDGERGTIKQVMREAVSRGWDMTELRKEKSSMEAVFAKLSGK